MVGPADATGERPIECVAMHLPLNELRINTTKARDNARPVAEAWGSRGPRAATAWARGVAPSKNERLNPKDRGCGGQREAWRTVGGLHRERDRSNRESEGRLRHIRERPVVVSGLYESPHSGPRLTGAGVIDTLVGRAGG